MLQNAYASQNGLGNKRSANKAFHLLQCSLLFFLLLYFASPLRSGNNKSTAFSTTFFSKKNSSAIEQWRLAKSIDKVNIYYIIRDCKGEKTVFLKVDNKNDYAVRISWKELFQTQQNVTVEKTDNKKEITLNAGQVMQGDCNNTSVKECVIPASQVTPAFKADVTKYEVADVTVSRNKTFTKK